MQKRNKKVKNLEKLKALLTNRKTGVLRLLSVGLLKMQVLRIVGIVAVGVLVILGMVVMNPVMDGASAANGYEQDLLNYEMAPAAVTLTMDSGVNGVIRAGDTDASMGVIKRTASLSVGTTNGYTVYLRANNANLTGKDVANSIPSVTSNSTLAQMLDRWGWYGVLGDVVADCDPLGTFKQIPITNTTLGRGGVTTETVNKKITMCFGTRVSGAKAADVYSNTVTVSVVAEPGQSSTRTFSGITTMQEMTSEICGRAAINDTTYLRDVRDNKGYWVTKLMDGNCWMSQNLDFDISTSNVTTTTSDVKTNWTSSSAYPPKVTATSLTTGGDGNTGTYSWDLGRYVTNVPTETTSCGDNTTGLGDCSMFTDVGSRTASTDPNFYRKSTYIGTDGSTCTKATNTSISMATSGVCAQYDAHYLVGNYYQWNAATAGTGATTVTNTSAVGSVCPKGWKLPDMNGVNEKGGFRYLLRQYGLATDAYSSNTVAGVSPINSNNYNIALSPVFFMRGGYINSGSSISIAGAGYEGRYWSSRAYRTDDNWTYHLSFDSNDVVPSRVNGGYLHYGFSIHCFVPTF